MPNNESKPDIILSIVHGGKTTGGKSAKKQNLVSRRLRFMG